MTFHHDDIDMNLYHGQVDYDRSWTLARVVEEKGKVTRMNMFQGRGLVDISYVHATLPDGRTVSVNIGSMPDVHLIPRRELKRNFILWAREEKVNAKALGLLDEGNWNIR